jgi:hypothetical protein
VLVAALLVGVAPNIGFAPPALPKSPPVAAPEEDGVPAFRLPKRLLVEGAAEVAAGLPNMEGLAPAPVLAFVVWPPNRLLPPPKVAGFEVAVEPNNPGPELAAVEVPPNSPPVGAADVVCAPPNNGVEVALDPNGLLLGAAPPLPGVGLKLNDMVRWCIRERLLV